jgi:acetylornithine deacetylase/succinyl-diaminopimelate desuccinylase-like protein
MMDVISLTSKLLSFNTINPPGNESEIAKFVYDPGQPEMAHQTNEFCYVNELEKSVEIYKNIILKWRN